MGNVNSYEFLMWKIKRVIVCYSCQLGVATWIIPCNYNVVNKSVSIVCLFYLSLESSTSSCKSVTSHMLIVGIAWLLSVSVFLSRCKVHFSKTQNERNHLKLSCLTFAEVFWLYHKTLTLFNEPYMHSRFCFVLLS